MHKQSKTLIKQRLKHLMVGLHESADPVIIACRFLQWDSVFLALLSGIDERTLRRYLAGDKVMPQHTREIIAPLLLRASTQLRRYSNVTARLQRTQKYKTFLVDLAIYLSVVFDQVYKESEEKREKVRASNLAAYYRKRDRASDVPARGKVRRKA